MLKTLRFKLISLTMISITLVVIAISGAVNASVAISLRYRADSMLHLISSFNGNMPHNAEALMNRADFEINSETPYRTRYFVIFTDKDGKMIKQMMARIASVDDKQLEDMCRHAVQIPDGKCRTIGLYRCLAEPVKGGRMLTFLDRSQDYESSVRLFRVSLIVSIIAVAVIFFVMLAISHKLLRPFVLNQEKQKQFITDAGHELKTPLAIIRTNAEVLEMCGGQSEWLDSIKNQTERLDGLVKGLLQLSKSNELPSEAEHTNFSLSAAVNSAAHPFKTLAEQKGHKIHFDIKPGINYKGNSEAIGTLVSILTDNAIKYASEGGEVFVSLYRMPKSTLKTAKLVIENDTDMNSAEDPNRFFERFYRSEGSRSRQTGGYGIGLSVAQTITENHKGKISVARTGGRIAFTVIL